MNKMNLLTKKNIGIAAIVLCLLLIILSAILIPATVTAKRNVDREKNIISVQIESGDTLWSIAQEYITDEYRNINAYIKEIKDVNNLSSDTIHAGNYLIIPYYN